MVPVTTPLRAEQPYLDRSIRLVEIGGLAGGHRLDPHLAKPVTYQDRRLMGLYYISICVVISRPFSPVTVSTRQNSEGTGRQRGKNDEEKMG